MAAFSHYTPPAPWISAAESFHAHAWAVLGQEEDEVQSIDRICELIQESATAYRQIVRPPAHLMDGRGRKRKEGSQRRKATLTKIQEWIQRWNSHGMGGRLLIMAGGGTIPWGWVGTQPEALAMLTSHAQGPDGWHTSEWIYEGEPLNMQVCWWWAPGAYSFSAGHLQEQEDIKTGERFWVWRAYGFDSSQFVRGECETEEEARAAWLAAHLKIRGVAE